MLHRLIYRSFSYISHSSYLHVTPRSATSKSSETRRRITDVSQSFEFRITRLERRAESDAYSGVSLFWKQGSGPEASTQPYLKRLQLRSIMPHLRNLFLKGLFLDFLVSHKSAIDRRSSQRTVDLASSQSHFTIEARTVCRLPCSRLKCANGLFTACNLGNRCHVRGEFISH